VLVEPGDRVEEGQVLLTFDVTELIQQKAQADTKALAYEREAAKYRAEGKLADEQLALLKRQEAVEESRYLQRQIDKHTIRAPIAGYVLRGDLRDKRGSPVKLGEVLFEIGESTGMEAELRVAERDIQDIAIGQTGYLATTALPNETYELTITRIVPIGEPSARGGDNVFKVYATLEQQSEHWYPGLEGEAPVRIEKRPLI